MNLKFNKNVVGHSTSGCICKTNSKNEGDTTGTRFILNFLCIESIKPSHVQADCLNDKGGKLPLHRSIPRPHSTADY